MFVRTSKSGSVSIRYGTDSSLAGTNISSEHITSADHDFTTQIQLSSLHASSTYYYDVLVDGAPQLPSPYPSFTTFPPVGENADFTVVVLNDFCCFSPTGVPDPCETFAHASSEAPTIVIIGGDFDHRNPRGSSEDDARAQKRRMFKELYTPGRNMEDFVHLILRRYPVAHMWDDHDYARNEAGKKYPFKDISLEVLQEYFPVYEVSRYGDWQKFRLAQAEFFLLDSRSQRDRPLTPDGPGKSMLDGDGLGPEGQLYWLKNGLLESNARWKFIISPVVFNPTVTKTDLWFGYSQEREHILSFIRRSGIDGVIIISGDLHAGGIDDGTNSGLPEMLVPSANLSRTHAACLTHRMIGIWSEGSYGDRSRTPCRGYGVIRVLTNPGRVVLEVKDDLGVVRLHHTVYEGEAIFP